MALIKMPRSFRRASFLCILIFTIFITISLMRRSNTSRIYMTRSERTKLDKLNMQLDWLDSSENGIYTKANAAIISLVRNEDLNGILSSIKSLQAAFNDQFNYTWVFINDMQFNSEFKAQTTQAVSGESIYLTIPDQDWKVPSHINQELMKASADFLKLNGVQYSDKLSYHQMCRWFSGPFFNHPELLKYRWYWRVEPDVQFFCKIEYDVFKFMERNNKKYGFTINVYDDPTTIHGLWKATLEYMSANPSNIHEDNSWHWLTDSIGRPEHHKNAGNYSTCHFWSNFEIADFEFFRGSAYQEYFRYLDKEGGFFYARWGDAPVHSIAAGLLLPRSAIHWFEDIGYNHVPYWNCPRSRKCAGCPSGKLFAGDDILKKEICLNRWIELTDYNVLDELMMING